MITLNNKHNVVIIKLNKHKKISLHDKSNHYSSNYLVKHNKRSLKFKHEITFIFIMFKSKKKYLKPKNSIILAQ